MPVQRAINSNGSNLNCLRNRLIVLSRFFLFWTLSPQKDHLHIFNHPKNAVAFCLMQNVLIFNILLSHYRRFVLQFNYKMYKSTGDDLIYLENPIQILNTMTICHALLYWYVNVACHMLYPFKLEQWLRDWKPKWTKTITLHFCGHCEQCGCWTDSCNIQKQISICILWEAVQWWFNPLNNLRFVACFVSASAQHSCALLNMLQLKECTKQNENTHVRLLCMLYGAHRMEESENRAYSL